MATYRYTSNQAAGKHGIQEVGNEIEYEYVVPNKGLGCMVFMIFVAIVGLLAVGVMHIM